MKKNIWDCIVIGGGASGLAAAVMIKTIDPDIRVLILEKNEMIGKKLRATGNGRCNLTNRQSPTVQETVDFFESVLKIPIIFDDQDRGYPFSESAAVVVDAFQRELDEKHVSIIFGEGVNAIEPLQAGDYLIKTGSKKYRTKNVILATGGKAGSQFGSTGDGFVLAKTLGHSVIKTIPVLTGICCEAMPAFLTGVRIKGELRLTYDDEPIFSEKGEIQMTEYGLSGICAFNLSRFLKYRDDRKLSPYRIHIDFDPERRLDDFIRKAGEQQKNLKHLLQSILKAPLVELFCQRLDCFDPERIIALLHDMDFVPVDVRGFKAAQCTAGGIPLTEINPETMMSDILPGLYFVGEILDYDGPCGGFNLDHAWQSGIKAAEAICRSVRMINEVERKGNPCINIE